MTEDENEELGAYEIGGFSVSMTTRQAKQWNCGDVTEESMRGATLFIPGRTGSRSYLRDGDVTVEDGLPTGESVSLWSMCEDDVFSAGHLTGNGANRVS